MSCKLWKVVTLFTAIIFIAALLFYFGTPRGWGIQPTFSDGNIAGAAPQIGFLDCLHFSVVTIATLGYGDYRPVSYGRLISAFEVIGGIILMGVFVAQLVSRQQDLLTRRLVRGQINTELQDFRDQVAVLLNDFKVNPPQIIPGQSTQLLYRMRGLAQSIASYWRHESMEPYLFDVIPMRAASRLLGDLIDLLELLDQSVAGKTRSDLHRDDFKAVRGFTESVLVISTILSERFNDHGLDHSQERVTALVQKLRTQFELRKRMGAL